MSQSALSHTIRGLEQRLGLRLLTRTTRSVSLTQAGERLIQTVGPRFEEIQAKLDELAGDGWLDADDPLTAEQKALIEERLDDLEKHPETSIPWPEAETRLKARFGE